MCANARHPTVTTRPARRTSCTLTGGLLSNTARTKVSARRGLRISDLETAITHHVSDQQRW